MRTTTIALALLAALAAGSAAHAGEPVEVSFSVDRGDDAPDANPFDGVCAVDAKPDEPKCTLRAAIMQANAMFVDVDVKVVLQPGATYALSVAGVDEDAGATGDLDVNRAMWIGTEPGAARARVDAQRLDRLFDVRAAQGSVVLSNMELVGGETSSYGAAIRSDAADLQGQHLDIHGIQAPDGSTAAIHVFAGITALTDSHVHTSGDPQYYFAGAWAQGQGTAVSLVRSAVSDIVGPGLIASEGATVLAQESTVAYNTIGVLSADGDVSILRSTVARNALRQIRLQNSQNAINQFTLVGSIVDTRDPDVDSCEFSIDGLLEEQRGANVYNDSSCEAPMGVVDQGSVVGNPELEAFGFHGGPTPTMLPAAASVAIDFVPANMCSDTDMDQRGYERLVGYINPDEPLCDVGAVERQPDVVEQAIFSDGFE